MKNIPKILIIAGSDSGAGAGIQADIKSASANFCYASTVITSITSQNTLGVQNVFNLSKNTIISQIDAVLSDISANFIKTGMLANIEIIEAVNEALKKYPHIPIVADPVMVAKGGYKLLEDSAIEALKKNILSKAYLVTPNIPEAEVLSGLKIHNKEDMIKASKKIFQEISCEYILIKGGHLEDAEIYDILFSKNNGAILEIPNKKIITNNTHGTGCSYASSIASLLARGFSITESIKQANNYIRNGILNAYKIGAGHNPINHFWNFHE